MKCNVVTDLLPLYAEHLTSDETAAELESHLAECASCAAKYAVMQEQSVPPITPPEDIHALKAVRRRGKRNILIAAAAVLLFWTLFYLFCLRGFQLRSDQIELEICTYWDLRNEENPHPSKKFHRFYNYDEALSAQKTEGGTIYEMIRVTMAGACLAVRPEIHDASMTVQNDIPTQYQPSVTDAALYSVYLPPLGTPGNMIKYKSFWKRVGLAAPVADGSTVMFRCSDGNFAYDLNVLAALAHASPDGTAHLTVGQRIADIPDA